MSKVDTAICTQRLEKHIPGAWARPSRCLSPAAIVEQLQAREGAAIGGPEALTANLDIIALSAMANPTMTAPQTSKHN